jgi:ADP-ribose pyrophosphatase YjhB (NUDIX family)
MEKILTFLESFYEPINEGKKKQKLAGILLMVDDKILLVKPNKFKGKKHKWSIPKGKVEKGISEIETALAELREETGILLNKRTIIQNVDNLTYKKSGKVKKLSYFIIKVNKGDLNVKFNKNNEIKPKYFKKSEIYRAKLFTISDSKSKLEFGQLKLIREL